MMDKATIRREALEKRNNISVQAKRIKSALVSKNLLAQGFLKEAKNILLYKSFGSEVDTARIISLLSDKKNLYLPRLVSKKHFIALPIGEGNDLVNNQFGIPEPLLTYVKRKPPHLDLILVPGVAFDKKGNRIGMGKGYYDRFLATQKDVLKVALAYSEQVLDQVPKEPYDEPINWIITENEAIRC